MTRIPFQLACLALVWAGTVTQVNTLSAQQPSLFEMRSPRMEYMYSDFRARRPGDLLFVKINEQSDVDNKDQRQMDKKNSSDSDASGSYTIGGDLGSGTGTLGFDQDSSANRSFDGNAKMILEREYKDQFTVRVIDIDRNGNLTIRGSRRVSLEGDNRTLVLSGVIRSDDIGADNSISSQKVASLMIRYETDPNYSPENKFINQGWLAKKFNRFWPH